MFLDNCEVWATLEKPSDETVQVAPGASGTAANMRTQPVVTLRRSSGDLHLMPDRLSIARPNYYYM